MLGVLLIGLFLVGCGSSTMSDKTTTVNTGDSTTVVKTGNTASWCQTGTEWKSTTAGTAAKMVIKELVATGKYKGLCHVVYDSNAGGDQVKAEYYFSKDGKSGYMVVDVNGQKIEQDWSG